jgi:hypothetical protein
MKLLFFIVFVFLFQELTFSQGAFYYQYIRPSSSDLGDVAEGSKGFLSVGNRSYSGSSIRNGFLLYLDKKGNYLWEKVTMNDSVTRQQYITAVFKSPYFYVVGNVEIHNETKYLVSKITEDGDILFSKILDTPFALGYDNFPSKVILDGETILIAGSGPTSVGTKGELLRIDLEGNILWKKKYSQFPNSTQYAERLDGIKKTKDNKYLLSIYSASSSSYDISTIINIDINGNEIWRKSYNTLISSQLTNDSLSFRSSTPYKKNHTITLFSVVNSDQYNPISYPRCDFALIEYDSVGNELSYRRYYNPTSLASHADIITNEKDELFILGSAEYGETEGFHLGAIKFNTEKEIPLDTHLQTGPLFNRGKITSDNGLALVTYDFYIEFNSSYFNPGFLKLDCQGDTIWNYNSCLSPTFHDLTLFPNPFSDNFTVQIPNISDNAIITTKIVDVTGKLIATKTFQNTQVLQIDASQWANGIYNCVFYVDGIFYDTKKIMKYAP